MEHVFHFVTDCTDDDVRGTLFLGSLVAVQIENKRGHHRMMSPRLAQTSVGLPITICITFRRFSQRFLFVVLRVQTLPF